MLRSQPRAERPDTLRSYRKSTGTWPIRDHSGLEVADECPARLETMTERRRLMAQFAGPNRNRVLLVLSRLDALGRDILGFPKIEGLQEHGFVDVFRTRRLL